MHGGSSVTGNLKGVTLNGQRQSLSNSLPVPLSSCMGHSATLNAMATTQVSSKDGEKALAKTPKLMVSSSGCMTLSTPQEHISTHAMSLASTIPQTSHHKGYLDPLICYSLLSPSLTLSCPLFEMRQSLQLGLDTSIHCSSITSSTALQCSKPSLAANWNELARKSMQPQLPEMMPNHLQATLAKNRADRRQPLSPHQTLPLANRTFSPACPLCSAKDRLFKWRPLLTTTTSPSGEDLEKHYQLTALA